ncbi:MAG: tRNA adenosine(34) deaminase TadA [Candidatus Kryptoniota bacterium]
MTEHEKYMLQALKEAERAYQEGEVPVGAVIVYNGAIIARAHNQTVALNDPTAHAEIIAIGAAANHLGTWRLTDCSLYVTLEPCPMCAGAIVLSRIERVVFGAYDPKMGACSTLYNIVQDDRLNHRAELLAGVLDDNSRLLLRRFFEDKRKNDNK